jgi:hypothetical protein
MWLVYQQTPHILKTHDIVSGRVEHVRCLTEPATIEAAEAGCKECIMSERSFSDETGQDLEPAVKMMCGHYIGMDCRQQRTDTFTVRKGQEEVSYPMCRTELCIRQCSSEVRGKLWEFVEYLRSDPALDQEVDQFLLNV